jgi:hypothetical protein
MSTAETNLSIPEIKFTLRLGHPDFRDLPWELPLEQWQGVCSRLEEAPRGLTRHPVVFVNYDGTLYALKEMPTHQAEKEYRLLSQIEMLRIPVVTPVGYVSVRTSKDNTGVLVTRYLEHSIPYRSLFMTGSLVRYREHLLDAIAGLLVQTHLAGIYWGDCSLSNTLFRRDAGALQAYLVDAETAEIRPDRTSAHLRHQDLDIMEDNVNSELIALAASGMLSDGFPAHDNGAYIRLRYQRLWNEITQEEVIGPSESLRIQERIRALNALGFSVGGIEYYKAPQGEQIRLRVLVTDRNFHRDQLFSLTGLEAEEMQARLMMNEIHELRAALSKANQRSTPLNVAAYHWMVNVYQPVIQRLQPLIDKDMNLAELYCQVLEHKWYLSEKARRDVGHDVAVEDYVRSFTNIT